MDLNALMKQAQQMQEKLQAAQQRLAESTVDGTSGGGMVRVTLSGAGEMKAVVLDEMQARLMQEAAGPLAGMGGMGGMPGFPKF